MLTFKMKLGDDAYVDDRQIILHSVKGDCLTVLTDDEIIEIPFGSEGVDLDGKTRLYSKPDPDMPGSYLFGFTAPADVLILTGRNWRKSQDA